MQIENQKLDFKMGQLVWAKVVGYPWWPAMVRLTTHTIDKEN